MSTQMGVSPQKAALYQQSDEFQCLDGSKTIPFEHVNDDYCDCADGSDEPGTSACSNGQFYCRNVGFKPMNVPSTRVNDFICDCCDGSDEWDDKVQCPNVCASQGAQAREEAKQTRIIQEAGYSKRLELAKTGAKSLEEKKTAVEKQKKELEELEPLKTSAELKKNAAEDKEKEAKDKHDTAWNEIKEEKKNEKAKELFMELDLNQDEKFSFEEFKKFKNQFIEPTKLDEEQPEAAEAAGIFQEIFGDLQELDFAGFRNVYDKVKETVAKFKESIKVAKDDHKKEEEKKAEDQDDSHDDGGEQSEQEEDEDKHKPPYDEVTEAAINEANTARQEYDEIVRKVSDLENGVRTSESFLEFEYGSDHAWAPYKDHCVELTTTQYTYKLCLFDRSVQKDRNGHSEVNLGYWSGWSGPEDNKYSTQKYDKDKVCGEELQLVDASEPSKCEYRFQLKSPAACVNPAELDHNEHSEL
uniref:Glucosidase 2 subunit beta n=1 Tax=Ditylenchus dipsaci TaxID=166011 RepID=A0A915DVQ9_9BILA